MRTERATCVVAETSATLIIRGLVTGHVMTCFPQAAFWELIARMTSSRPTERSSTYLRDAAALQLERTGRTTEAKHIKAEVAFVRAAFQTAPASAPAPSPSPAPTSGGGGGRSGGRGGRGGGRGGGQGGKGTGRLAIAWRLINFKLDLTAAVSPSLAATWRVAGSDVPADE